MLNIHDEPVLQESGLRPLRYRELFEFETRVAVGHSET